MSNIAKIPKDQEDRLSSLPDSILRHILSFMPTKSAARTSVLSKHWKHLFLSVPKIHLEEWSWDAKPQRNQDFIDFVNRRLMLSGEPSIDEFRLLYGWEEPYLIDLWLPALVSDHNVKVLEINGLLLTGTGTPLCLPTGIFMSETIQVMKINGIMFKIPRFLCLPNLKVLHLSNLELHFECNNFRFADGYPVLEDFSLMGVTLPKNKKDFLTISVPSLKRFALSNGLPEEPNRIEIDCPNLQCLEFSFADCGILTPQINLVNPESLLSAQFSLFPSSRIFSSPWFVELLRQIEIRELHLCNNFSEGLVNYADSLPTLRHLIRLELTAFRDLMWTLLQRSPNLEALDYDMPCFLRVSKPPSNVPLCLTQKLKEINVREFQEDDDDAFETLEYFLEHGTVLTKMTIQMNNCIKDWPDESVSRRLFHLQRCSPRCQIEITKISG